MKVGI